MNLLAKASVLGRKITELSVWNGCSWQWCFIGGFLTMKSESAVRKQEVELESVNPLLSPEAVSELIISHMALGERLARSFLNRWRVRMHPSDITSVIGVALCEAANRFDPERGVTFKTFFFYHLRGMLIKDITRVVEDRRVCMALPDLETGEVAPNTEPLPGQWMSKLIEKSTPEQLLHQRQVSRICWKACSQLDELEQEVIVRHFLFDQSLIDIADELGYCRCHISRVKSRSLAFLHKQLRQLVPGMVAYISDPENSEPAAEPETERTRYTGGRGRRKTEKKEKKNIEIIEKLLRQAA